MAKLFTLLLLLILVVYYKGVVQIVGSFGSAFVSLGYMLTGRNQSGQFIDYSANGPAPGPPPPPPAAANTNGGGGPIAGPSATDLTLFNQPGFSGASASVSGDQHYIAVGALFNAGVGDVRSIRANPPGACYTLYEGINYGMGSVAVCGDVSDTWTTIPWHASDPGRSVSSIKMGGGSLGGNQGDNGPGSVPSSPGTIPTCGDGTNPGSGGSGFDCIRSQCTRGDSACAARVAPWATSIPMSSYGWN